MPYLEVHDAPFARFVVLRRGAINVGSEALACPVRCNQLKED